MIQGFAFIIVLRDRTVSIIICNNNFIPQYIIAPCGVNNSYGIIDLSNTKMILTDTESLSNLKLDVENIKPLFIGSNLKKQMVK
jgi:hypothetical protein